MEGTCNCGGRISESNHAVITDKGAAAWVDPLTSYKLPLKIETSTCNACGRRRTVARDDLGTVVSERG